VRQFRAQLRPAARRIPQHAQKTRFASSSTEATQQKAQDAAQAAQKKATEAFASAQAGASKAFESGKKVLGPFGERIGNLLGSYRQPIFYNLAVAREVVKRVYIAEKLAPPTSFHTIRTAYETIWNRAKDFTYWRSAINTGEWQKLALYGLEAYGIFKIGEMIGRRHVVGYKLE